MRKLDRLLIAGIVSLLLSVPPVRRNPRRPTAPGP